MTENMRVSSGGEERLYVNRVEGVDVVAKLEAADGEDVCSEGRARQSVEAHQTSSAMFLFASFSFPLSPFSFQHFRERRITQDSEAKFKNHDRGDVAET
jgi:hypothetical protein